MVEYQSLLCVVDVLLVMTFTGCEIIPNCTALYKLKGLLNQAAGAHLVS